MRGCASAVAVDPGAEVAGRQDEYSRCYRHEHGWCCRRATDVMVVTRWGATSPATGKSTSMDIHHWWRFREGKICYYRGTEDTAQTQNLLHQD